MKYGLHIVVAYFSLCLSYSAHADPVQQQGDDLDRRVATIITSKCVMCHDSKKGSAAGDVDYLLDFVELTSPQNFLITPEQPKESHLFSLINDDEMPVEGDNWSGPLSAEEKVDFLNWVKRGGPSAEYRNAVGAIFDRRLISIPNLYRDISRDLKEEEKRESKAYVQHVRYLTLTNLHNNLQVTNSELETYRQGVVKTLNSLSRTSDVLGLPESDASKKIVFVDKEKTIIRFNLSDLNWNEADWELILKHYPYRIETLDEHEEFISNATSSKHPHMRADWFVFATLQPPLYHDLLGIPQKLQDLERNLKIDINRNIQHGEVSRAGFGKSKVSVNNRIVERHLLPNGGWFWISYDFSGNDGKRNIFDNPIGPAEALGGKFAFQHDGGEIIYMLPNGFLAGVLITADGKRLSIAPSAIVQDNSMPGSRIINGISCISCHKRGMQPENEDRLNKLDRIRTLALKNFARFRNKERQLIDQLYARPEKMADLLHRDGERFRSALELAGITISNKEPARELFDRFAKDLNVETAAAGFGLSVTDFETAMRNEGATRQILNRLASEGVQRQFYVAEFQQISQLIGIGDVREAAPIKLPYFGEDPDQSIAAVKTEKVQSPILKQNRKNGKMNVRIRSIGNQRQFLQGQTIAFEVISNTSGFLTLLSTDPNGDVTVLIPNKWHGEFQLKANQRVLIPTTTMGFEFVATPPNGLTTVKAIVTKTPLVIDGVEQKSLKQQGVITFSKSKAINVRRKNKPNTGDLNQLFKSDEWATDQIQIVTNK